MHLELSNILLSIAVCRLFVAADDDFFITASKREYEDFLTDDDFDNAKQPGAFRRPPLVVDGGDDAMYQRDKFEGDIANPGLNADTVAQFMRTDDPFDDDGVLRNAVRNTYLLWPNKRVPYSLSSQYTSYSRSQIASAMSDYARRTCIDFVPRGTRDRDYIYIMPDGGCYSLVGKTGGRQILSLGSGCLSKGIIIHELMHAVGFFHEQSRTDRDQYVTIQWNNIIYGMEGQFRSYSSGTIQDLGTSYDYGSIMHYTSRAFSRNGAATIVPRRSGVSIGQRRGFSSNDVTKINRLYKCDGGGGSVVTTTRRPRATTTRRTTPRPRATTTRRSVTPPPPRPVTGGRCADQRDDCDWLVRQFDACSTQYKFMRSYCASTCSLCNGGVTPRPKRPAPPTRPPAPGGGGGGCRDFRTECGVFARAGLCDGGVFSGYMRRQCPQSCNTCGTGGSGGRRGGGGGGRGGGGRSRG